MSDHHPTLSPSRFPALAHCIHYQPVQLDSVSRARGTKIHEYMARFLNGPGGSWPKEDIEYAAKGEWLAKEIRRVIPNLLGVEYKISVWNYAEVPPEEVTFGTCDAWGYNGKYLIMVDAKSGQRRDYCQQMAVYALGLMEDQGRDYCLIYLLYCDTEDIVPYGFTKEEAERIVFDIIARVNAGAEPPQENEHCNFCALMPTCEVWTYPAQQAFDLATQQVFNLEALKADPIRLGEFLTKWSKAEKLVDAAKLKDAAKRLLAADSESVPGWQVSPVNGRKSYGEDQIEEILFLLPELGMDRARSFLNVNQEAFERAWKTHSKKPVPVFPTEHAGTYLRLTQKK